MGSSRCFAVSYGLMLALAVLTASCAPVGVVKTAAEEEVRGWRLAYAHDDQGAALDGSLEDLIAAVRAGKPVRVYVKGRRVEHSAGAQFLTIFEGHVFAQISEIQGQAPSSDPPRIAFRAPGTYWRAIYGTTGAVEALMDGNEPRQNRAALSWFVED